VDLTNVTWNRFLSWPELIISIGLISGVSWSTIIYNILLLWIFIVCNLIGALTATTYKWGFFTFGTVSSLFLIFSLFITGLPTSTRLGIKNQYLGLASWISFLFLLYPIAWGLCDGGNEISVTSGVVFVGILDVLMVPTVAAGMLFLGRMWDYKALNIYFTQYGRAAMHSGEFLEKKSVVIDEPLREGMSGETV
jgi:bacteriorhodopsin